MKSSENKKICFSDKEFHILYSAVVEIREDYHKPNPPSAIINEKFGLSLKELDLLVTKLKKLKNKDNITINFDKKLYMFFCVVLGEIINNYEYYEFQTITGFWKGEVTKLLKKIKPLKDK